jgi:aminotransferase in exopolysaccharide biosynthesis
MTTRDQRIIQRIREVFATPQGNIPLHAPLFTGNERRYVLDAIESTFVSSVGAYVGRLETMIAECVGAGFAIATVNGTSALHIALHLMGVRSGDLVITQPITFVATGNAIAYCGASPALLDVDMDSMGLSPEALEEYLNRYCRQRDGRCVHEPTGRPVSACVPVHTLGHPCRIDAIASLCREWGVALVEDAAESLGSLYKGRHVGLFGDVGILSFNGNKIVTAGGGGAILCNSEEVAARAKHLTTTAKRPHPYEYIHDDVGYNYRMPNLNAALACAQVERLEEFVRNKRELAREYQACFDTEPDVHFMREPRDSRSNYWLNAILLPDKASRDAFLEESNAVGVMTRPVWQLLHRQPMFARCVSGPLVNAEELERRLVSIPSSVRGL